MSKPNSLPAGRSRSDTPYVPEDRKQPVIFDDDYMDRVEWGIHHLNELSVSNQKKYKRIKKVGIIIGGTIPIAVTLSAFEQIDKLELMRIPLLIYAAVGGTVLALMNNFLKTGNYFDNWRNFRNMSESLQREKYLYLTKMDPYNTSDAFPVLVEKVEDLLGDKEAGKKEL